MSTPDKIDHARGWMSAEDGLAEEEAERIEKLGDDELLAEMRQRGTDPATVPTADELMARVRARRQVLSMARSGAAPRGGSTTPPIETAGRVASLPVKSAKRPLRVVLLIAAALVALVAFEVLSSRPHNVARPRGPTGGQEGDAGVSTSAPR